jgi:hypothetical protein
MPEPIQEPGKDDAAKAASAPVTKNELPQVESPSISPAEDVPNAEPVESAAETHALTIFEARPEAGPKPRSRFTITPRMKRSGLLAACVAVAAVFGAGAGVLAGTVFSSQEPKPDVTGIEETQSMRKTIAHLSTEITTLKAGIDAANKTAASQIGKLAERIEKIDRLPETTASISKAAAPAAMPASLVTPLPPVKPQIVQGWTARASRDGVILVEGRGEVYQVSPGVPLPGLGPVESIKREGDRWVVATPKGIIVSSNAVPPPRPRPYYPPYFRSF